MGWQKMDKCKINHTTLKKILIKKILISLFLILSFYASSQFSPQVGINGSEAIPASCPLFKAWAQNAYVERGYLLLEDTSFTIANNNRTSYGTIENIYGPADNKVLSLGDRGCATILLTEPLYNGIGWDFAIFENGFISPYDSSLAFLELATVSVSSDGKNFVTFPCVSLTQDTIQITNFDFLDATKIHNLAGKYISNFGVPFDLDVLQDYYPSILDLNNILYIRICDVGGSINPLLASYDSQGHIINDPYPSPFISGGFDLDAVGLRNIKQEDYVKIYPNPSKDIFYISSKKTINELIISDLHGKILLNLKVNIKFSKINLSFLKSGLYFCLLKINKDIIVKKIILL